MDISYDIKKTKKFKDILEYQIDQAVAQQLSDEMTDDILAGRPILSDAKVEKKRAKLLAEIYNTPDLLDIYENKATTLYYGGEVRKKKSESKPFREPEIFTSPTKQGVFSTMTQLALRAGRAFIPKKRDQAKVYMDTGFSNVGGR